MWYQKMHAGGGWETIIKINITSHGLVLYTSCCTVMYGNRTLECHIKFLFVTVNDDWYEGRVNGNTGIFPKSYVKDA